MSEKNHEPSTKGSQGSSVTREKLLDATVRVAAAQGVDRVTWRSVAAEAGFSHSLVRFYFGSGEEMITQAIERAARLNVEESTLLALDADSFLSDLVETLSRASSKGLVQYDFLLKAVRGTAPMDPVRSNYDFFNDQMGRSLQNMGIKDPDGTLATVVFAAIDGLILQHAIYNSNERTEAAVERLREMLRVLARTQQTAQAGIDKQG